MILNIIILVIIYLKEYKYNNNNNNNNNNMNQERKENFLFSQELINIILDNIHSDTIYNVSSSRYFVVHFENKYYTGSKNIYGIMKVLKNNNVNYKMDFERWKVWTVEQYGDFLRGEALICYKEELKYAIQNILTSFNLDIRRPNKRY